MTAIAATITEHYQLLAKAEGRAEGKAEGRAEGKAEGKRIGEERGKLIAKQETLAMLDELKASGILNEAQYNSKADPIRKEIQALQASQN